jgi:predicted nucleic acid-binding protein
MAFEPSITVCDACVLYPFHLRNIIVQAAVDRLVDLHWTAEIHDEWIRNLIAKTPAISVERLQITRQLMEHALPTATVVDYEKHIPAVVLPDPNDRHVVAAAIAAKASLIVTWNLRDFPIATLEKHGLRRLSPDTFLADLYDKVPQLVVSSLANARRNLRRTDTSAASFIDILTHHKLARLANRVEKHLADL